MSAKPRETERDFQRAVIELARLLKWRVAHFRQARTAKGWRTPVEADGAGFPDLVLLRRERQVVAELKADRGVIRPEQREWIEAFKAAGVEAHVWRPENWSEVESCLR